jgi:hypothetical protein
MKKPAKVFLTESWKPNFTGISMVSSRQTRRGPKKGKEKERAREREEEGFKMGVC